MKVSWLLLGMALLMQVNIGTAQQLGDPTEVKVNKPINFSGTISATNNGISIVPTFSLGKPAAIAILSINKGRWSFDPDIRFSMAGKPWVFLFWGRYKLATTKKLTSNIGTHLGLNYQTNKLPINGDTSETTITRRYAAAEVNHQYHISKNCSVGVYYLYSHGLDAGTIGNGHFATLNTNFSHIAITKKYFLQVSPQVFYLKLDARDGFYSTLNIAVKKQNAPLSLAALFNKQINSNIIGSKPFLWSVSVVYSFHNKYAQQ